MSTASRLRRYLIALPAGLAVGVLVLIATSDGLKTIRGGRIGGDLPAFYGAARIIRSGHGRELYDARLQEEAQRDLLPVAGRLPFPYPPYVAVAYVPLTWLPFKAAYVFHLLLMASCIVGALLLLRARLPVLRAEFLPVVSVTICAYPIFRAVLGGQNTPLSLLCAAGAAVSLARGRELAAGLWIGAWLFKPQLALPVAALILIGREGRGRFLSGVAAVGCVYYLVGAAIGGWNWPLWWWREGAMPFAVADLVIDRANGISLPAAASYLGAAPVGWLAAAAVAIAVTWLAWRTRLDAIALVAAAAAAAVLCAPYALYYDGGLAALGLIVAWAARTARLPIVAAVWLLAWLQPVRESLPLPPLTIVLVASLVLVARVLRVEPRAVDGELLVR